MPLNAPEVNGNDAAPEVELQEIDGALGCKDDPWLPMQLGIDDFNTRFCIVIIRGRPCVLRYNDENGRRVLLPTFYTFDDFKRAHQHHRVWVPKFDKHGSIDGRKQAQMADLWLKNKHAVRFPMGIDCEPNADNLRFGTYNLWQGFIWQGYEREGDWPLIRHHLLSHICAGNQANFDWLVKWMARAIQEPGKRAEVMVVLRGPEGEGKGFVAKLLKFMFDGYYTIAYTKEDLFGRFNDHLLNTLLLHIDEGFHTGRAEEEAKLKTLITEDEMQIEIKYVNKFKAPNRTKIVMTTNSDWAVPAGPNARRYFVLDVPGGKAHDRQYFDELFGTLCKGGQAECFFHHLLNLDLTGFDWRRPPVTQGLQEQMEMSLGSFPTWWLSCLENGAIGLSWPASIGKKALHQYYMTHADADGVSMHHRVKSNAVKKRLKALVGKLEEGENRTAIDDRRTWVLPSLAECRAAWDKLYGPREWPILPTPAEKNGKPEGAEIVDFPHTSHTSHTFSEEVGESAGEGA